MTAESIAAAPVLMQDRIDRIIIMLVGGKHHLTLTHAEPSVGSSHFGPEVAIEVGRLLADRASRTDPAPAGVEEAVARAICRARDLNPDCLHQHHEWEDYPTDASEEVGAHFDNPAFIRLMHYGWRHHVIAARAAIAAMPASRTDEEAIRRAAFPALTEAMMIAAAEAHYGKAKVAASGGIDGISMTVNGQDYSFRDMMRRMWPAIRRARLRAEKAAAGGGSDAM